LPGFAAELVGKGVDVIATFGGPATNAARKASTTVPIVAALVADPVAIGVAVTLKRPGGNITGATNNDPELPGLQLAMLKSLFPKLARVAILSGGLLSFGTSFAANFPRLPIIIDRIFKGAKPADTSFEVVSHRELAINLKTARELGLAIPAELLKRANSVIG
jgi:ABC-type uncharacterized transport system substrate-binding protein